MVIYTKSQEVCGQSINIEVVPPLDAITASTLLGRLSTTCWNLAAGSCFNLARRAWVRSGTVGWLGLARSRRSNSSQRCSLRLRLGFYAGQSSSSTPLSTDHFCMDVALCTGALSYRNSKGYGLQVNYRSGFFMYKIVFCGREIDRNGLHKTQDKIDAVVQAPQPQNITCQIKSNLFI